jgi:hypothetical protein
MTSLVYKNTTFTTQLDNTEFIIGQDGKVYASEASFWPTPISQEAETPVKKTRKLRGNGNSIASVVRTTFKRKTKDFVLITANSQDTIRKAFLNEGWKASIRSTNKQNVFDVKRVA